MVVTHLIRNAQDATGADGSIDISTEISDDVGIIVISDTGSGMSPDVLARAFDPFFSTKGDAGTGMGLATVYGIVQNLQGFITLNSTLEEGTQFAIYLPTTDQKRKYVKPSRLTSIENQNWFGNETVLVVEDEPLLRELLHHLQKSFALLAEQIFYRHTAIIKK